MRAHMLVAAGFAATLAACNAARSPQAVAVAPNPATSPAAPAASPGDLRTPEGAGCAGAIARYRSVIDNDLAMGHVNKGVHGQISNEISQAADACANGQDARAQSLLRGSKSRHGYPG